MNGHPDSRGVWRQTALALTAEGGPWGLLSQESWARDPATFGTAAQRRTRRGAEKERQQWLTGLPRVAAARPVGPCVGLGQEREAEVVALLAAPRPAHIALVVRVCQPRRVAVEAGTAGGPGHVLAAARQAPVVGQLPVQVPRKPGPPERAAVLELAARAGRVKAPRRRTADGPAGTLALGVVRATALAPPAGGKPLAWILLTTWALESFAPASRCGQAYALRGRVERCPSTLKPGCTVERLQFEEVHTLKNALARYALGAWRLLWLTYTAREQPQAPATEVLPPLELQVLRAGHSGTGSHRPGGNSGPRPVGRLPHEPFGQRAGRQSPLAGVAPARSHGGRRVARLTSLAFYATSSHPVPICPSKVSVSRTFLGCGQDRTALCISPISERR